MHDKYKPMELNLDKKWQSDDLFYMTKNKIQPILSNFKDIIIYLKHYLLLNITKLAWYFNSIIYGGLVVGVSINDNNLLTRMADFLHGYD